MAEEQVMELPQELREWVQERAEEGGQEPADVLARSVAAYRFIEGESDALVAANGEQGGPVILEDEAAVERLEAIEERLGELADRVDGLEGTLDEQIEDVRDRVIQVKREADAKAPADHDHEELRERVTETMEVARESGETAAKARDETEALGERVDEGFDNFEEVLEYLTETTDELDRKAEKLARMAIDLRERVGQLEGSMTARDAAAELQTKANSEGISAAVCDRCGATVRLGLLSSPHCPDCEATFSDVEPSRGFLGSATLRTGGHPALESGEASAPASPAELFDQDEESEQSDDDGR